MRATTINGRLPAMRFPALASLACIFSAAQPTCEPVPGPDAGSPAGCTAGETPTVELGHGVGGAFISFTDGESVGITVAPQGGYGVPVQARTTGLEANDDSRATVRVATEINGEDAGQFMLYQQPLLCDGASGVVTAIVVGLDPTRYGSNDALLALDGVQATLIVDVIDNNDVSGHGEQVVTLQVGE
ncbi:MAG: hypothetical protein HYS27_12560 [Deltaproteobacteria bacterium]|nr:hypothetical protein [Deltaproteobacteria bacterium]